MVIYTKFITLRNGKRVYASEKGLDCFCFEVDDDKYQDYLKRKADKSEK